MSLQPIPEQDIFNFPIAHLSSSAIGSMSFSMEQIGFGVTYWDLDDQTIYWSERVITLCGLSLDGSYLTYHDYLMQVHPDDRLELKRLIEQVANSLEVGRIEYRVFVDQQEQWLRSCFSPNAKDGRLTHIIEVVSNVSELKMTQQALIDSEMRWRKLSGCISNVLIETTFSGEIVSTTDATATH